MAFYYEVVGTADSSVVLTWTDTADLTSQELTDQATRQLNERGYFGGSYVAYKYESEGGLDLLSAEFSL